MNIICRSAARTSGASEFDSLSPLRRLAARRRRALKMDGNNIEAWAGNGTSSSLTGPDRMTVTPIGESEIRPQSTPTVPHAHGPLIVNKVVDNRSQIIEELDERLPLAARLHSPPRTRRSGMLHHRACQQPDPQPPASASKPSSANAPPRPLPSLLKRCPSPNCSPSASRTNGSWNG